MEGELVIDPTPRGRLRRWVRLWPSFSEQKSCAEQGSNSVSHVEKFFENSAYVASANSSPSGLLEKGRGDRDIELELEDVSYP